MKTRILSVLLLIAMLVTMVPVSAVAETVPTSTAPEVNASTPNTEELYQLYVQDGLVALYTAFSDDGSVNLAKGEWANKVVGGAPAILRDESTAGNYWTKYAMGIGYAMSYEQFKTKGDGRLVGITIPDQYYTDNVTVDAFAKVKGITNEDGSLMVRANETFIDRTSAFRLGLFSSFFFATLRGGTASGERVYDYYKTPNQPNTWSYGYSSSHAIRWFVQNVGFKLANPTAPAYQVAQENGWLMARGHYSDDANCDQTVPTAAVMHMEKITVPGATREETTITYKLSYNVDQQIMYYTTNANSFGITTTVTGAVHDQIASEERTDKNEFADGDISLFNGVPGEIYAIRVYNRALTADEKAMNRLIDLVYYHGAELPALFYSDATVRQTVASIANSITISEDAAKKAANKLMLEEAVNAVAVRQEILSRYAATEDLVAFFTAYDKTTINLENGTWTDIIGGSVATFENKSEWVIRENGSVGFDAWGGYMKDGVYTKGKSGFTGNTAAYAIDKNIRLQLDINMLPDEDFTVEYLTANRPLLIADADKTPANGKVVYYQDANGYVAAYDYEVATGIDTIPQSATGRAGDQIGFFGNHTQNIDGKGGWGTAPRGSAYWLFGTAYFGNPTNESGVGGGGFPATTAKGDSDGLAKTTDPWRVTGGATFNTYSVSVDETVKGADTEALFALYRDGAFYSDNSKAVNSTANNAAADICKNAYYYYVGSDNRIYYRSGSTYYDDLTGAAKPDSVTVGSQKGEDWSTSYFAGDYTEFIGNYSQGRHGFWLSAGVPTDFLSVRVYDRVLTEEELLQNHFVDILIYYELSFEDSVFDDEKMLSRCATAFKDAVIVADAAEKEANKVAYQALLDNTLAVTFVPDEYEDIASCDTLLECERNDGYSTCWYRFIPVASGTYTLYMDASRSECDCPVKEIDVYNDKGENLIHSTRMYKGCTLSYYFEEGKVYYFLVDSGDGDEFLLSLNPVSFDSAYAETGAPPVDYTETQIGSGHGYAGRELGTARTELWAEHYSFTPTETAMYRFVSSSDTSTDLSLCLRDATGLSLGVKSTTTESEVALEYVCEAGVTYYVGLVGVGNSSDFSFNFHVEKVEVASSHTVTFLDKDGSVLKQETLAEGAVITAPDVPETVKDLENIYTFTGFDGYTAGMTATGDMTFIATYTMTPIYTYTVSNGKATITGFNVAQTGALTLPSTLGGYPVMFIGTSAFQYCADLTSIVIPASVTHIFDKAFDGCRSLTSVVIPDSVTRIGNYAFQNCSGLTSITIGEGVTSIGASAFNGCYKLVEVINKSSLAIAVGSTTVGSVTYYAKEVHAGESKIVNQNGYLFYTYNGINYLLGYVGADTSLTLPASYNGQSYEIYKYAFYKRSNLTTIVIPDSVTSIGAYAFAYCYNFTSVVIPDSVTSIGSYTFRDCSNLASVVIPDSVTSIGDYAFYNCINLTSIVIPDSVTSIDEGAFYGCYKLVEVINKSSLSITAGSGTYGYVAYYAIEVHTGESKIVNQNGYLFYTYNGVNCFFGYVGTVTSLTLPESYNGQSYKIYNYAFYNCSNLTSIVIPDGVTSIGSSAFEGCTGITSLAIPDSVQNIGERAFAYCAGIASITVAAGNPTYHSAGNCLIETASKTLIAGCNTSVIPSDGSVTSIGSLAFHNRSNLTSITIPNSVTSIGEYAFYSCSGLTSIVIPDSVTSIGNYAFYYCSNLTSVTIGNGVTSIGEYAFLSCSNLTSVTIGSGVTSIGDFAFQSCSNLTSIVIPDSVTRIGNYAFRSCSSLTSITFGENSKLMSIGGYAFDDCDSLTSITLPDSVKVIAHYAFYSCDSLTSVTIGNGLTGLNTRTFGHCRNLTSVTFGENSKLRSIGYGAFEDCKRLTSIVIPEGVTSIGAYAFDGCLGLVNITIPDSVTSIGEYGFRYCSSVQTVTYTGTRAEWDAINFANETADPTYYGAELICLGDAAFVPDTFVDIFSCDTKYGWDETTYYRFIPTASGTYTFYTWDSEHFGYAVDTVLLDGTGKELARDQSLDQIKDEITYYFEAGKVYYFKVQSDIQSRHLLTLEPVSLESGSSAPPVNTETIEVGKTYIADESNAEAYDYSWGKYVWVKHFTFVPSATMEYGFAVMENNTNYYAQCNQYLCLRDENGVILNASNHIDVYMLTYVCEAGKTYYFDVVCQDGIGAEIWVEAGYHEHVETDFIIDKTPTCTVAGTKHTECTLCGETVTTVTLPAIGHTADAWIVDREPTCLTSGLSHMECLTCGETIEIKQSPALGHNFVLVEEKAATCTEDGYQKFACDRDGCHAEKTQKILAFGHDFGTDNVCDSCGFEKEIHTHSYTETVVAPTCMTVGYTLHTCSCGDSYRDNYVDQLGHRWNDGVVKTEKTCTKDGVMEYACENCSATYTEIIPAGHTWNETVEREATCTTEGVTVRACSLCGASSTTTIPAGHKWNAGEVITEATCDTEGVKRCECSVCGESEDIAIPAKGHRFVNGKCTVCGAGIGQIITPDTEHPEYGMYFEIDDIRSAYGPDLINEYGVLLDYNKDANIKKVAVFLTQDGTMWRRCIAVVGEGITYATYVPYLSYDEDIKYTGLNSAWINTFNLKENADGIWCYSNYATIGVNLADYKGNLLLSLYDIGQAGAKTRVFDDLDEMIEWLRTCDDHTESSFIVDREPTCVEAGEKHTQCTTCGKVLAIETIPATDSHTESGWIVDEQENCTDPGWKHKECTVCGKKLAEEGISPTRIHTAGEWIIDHEPTCEQEGQKHNACTQCGMIMEMVIIDKLPHTPSGWIVDEQATCTVNGEKHKECTVCHWTIERAEIPMIDHTPSDWIVDYEATCCHTGEKYKECTVCGEPLEYAEIPMLDHTPSEWIVDREATCTVKGEKHKECTVCSALLEYADIPMLDHTPSDWIDIVEPTCEVPGSRRKVCTVCFEQLAFEYLYTDCIPVGWVVVKEPTCTEDGLKQSRCTMCPDMMSEVIPATGIHEAGAWIIDTAATCVANGAKHTECTMCGKTMDTAVIPATGDHTEGAFIIDREPTCVDAGAKHTECTVCHKTMTTEVIPATGDHTEGDFIIDREPTCVDAGAKHTECTVCHKTMTTEEIPATGIHTYTDEYDHDCNVCGYERYLIGDVNGDGKKNSDDSVYLLYHIFTPEKNPVNQPLDFNADGKVTSDDAIYLLYNIFWGESLYPLRDATRA